MISRFKHSLIAFVSAVVLSILLFFEPFLLSVPVAYAAEEQTAESSVDYLSTQKDADKAKEKKVVKELVDKRTDKSKTYLMSDGSYEAKLYAEPIHYKDSTGKWAEIDDTLVATPDGRAYVNKADRFRVTLSKVAGMASFEIAGKKISFALLDDLSLSSVFENEARYDSSTGKAGLIYSVTSTGLKESIVLPNKQAAKTFSFRLDLNGLDYRLEEGGAIAFLDEATGDTVAYMPKPYMFDSRVDTATGEEMPIFSEDVTQTVSFAGKNLTVEITPSSDWLNDPKRVYPVYIDPSLNLANQGDTYVSEYSPATNYGNATELLDGVSDIDYKNNYPLIKFDTSPLNGYTINSATLNIYAKYAYSGSTPTPVWLNRATSSWSAGSVTWNTKPTTAALTSGNVASGAWASFDVKAAVQNFLDGTWTNYGFLLDEDGVAALDANADWSSTSWTWANNKFGSGDFNGDGKMDVVSLYNYGSTMGIRIFTSTGAALNNPTDWWTGSALSWTYSKLVTGDFDANGKSDIAIVYRDGADTTTRVKMFLTNSSGTGFASSNVQWWSSTAWDWTKTTPIAGNFNGDTTNGRGRTDLAFVYDYGGSTTRIWTLTSTGSSFNGPADWWYSTGWTASSGKYLASGDYTGDGKADVVAFYNYAGSQTRAWAFTSTGSSFSGPSQWWDSGAGNWNWSSSTFVATDITGDNKMDVAAFYDYGSSTTAGFSFASTGSAFTTPAKFWSYGWDWNGLKFVGGAFSADNHGDVVAFRNEGTTTTKAYFLQGERMKPVYFKKFSSNESTTNKPYLSVTYNDPGSFDLTSPDDDSFTNNDQPTLSWSPSGNHDYYQLYVDGQLNRDNIPKTATSTTPISPLSDGSHTWYVRAVSDRTGTPVYTQSTSTRTINVDTAQPAEFSLVNPPTGSTTNDAWPLFAWNASTDTASGLAEYELYVDGNLAVDNIPVDSTSTVETQTASALSDGPHTFYVKAIDKAGNVRQSATSSFTVESTPMLGLQPYWTYWNYDLGGGYSAKVNVANRNLILTKKDINIKDVNGMDIELSVYYNSMDSATTPLGKWWRFGIPQLDTSKADGTLVLTEESGTRFYFGKKPDNSYARPAGLDEDIVKNGDNTYTWTRKNQDKYTFDSSGKLKTIVDSNGNTIAYTYDAQNRLSKIAYPSGKSINFTYGTELEVKLKDENQADIRTVKYGVAGNRLLTKYDPVQHTTGFSYAYDSGSGNYHLNRIEILAGPSGFPPDQQYTDYEIDPSTGVVSRVAHSPGQEQVTIATFSAADSTTTVADAVAGTTFYEHNAHGNVTKIIDPHQNVTELSWDGRNRPVEGKDSEGASASATYDQNGNPTSITQKLSSEESATVNLQYDGRNNQISATDPQTGKTATSASYDAKGNVQSTKDEERKEADANVYDSKGNIVARTEPGSPTYNLIINGSFEHLSGGYPDAWQSFGSADFSIDSSVEAVHGQNSAKISASASGSNYYSQVLPVTAGMKLTLFVNMRLENVSGTGGADFGIQFHGEGGALIDSVYSLSWTGTGNIAQPLVATAPEGATDAYVYLRLMNATGDVWFDGVQLEAPVKADEGHTLTAFDYVENSSFEVTGESGPFYWTKSQNGASVDATEKWAGLKSAKLSLPTQDTAYFTSYAIGVAPGKDMTLSGFIKTVDVTSTAGGGARIEVNFRDANNQSLETTSTAYQAKDKDWTRYATLARTPANARWAYVSVVLSNAKGTAFFDNVKLTPAETTRYTYNAAGQVTSETDPLGNVTRHDYDAFSRETTATDPEGNVTAFTYNALDLITSVTDALGNKTYYDYDWIGKLTKVRDARSASAEDTTYATSYAYTSTNKIASVTDPLGRTTSYEYANGLGEPIAVHTPRGDTIYNTYENGRLKTKGYVQGSPTYTYTYNKTGNVTKVSDSSGDYLYSYDDANRLIASTDTAGYVLDYTLDKNGNPTRIADNKGNAVSMTYGSAGKLLTLTDPSNTQNTFSYDGQGRLIQTTKGGVVQSYSYDAAGHLINLIQQKRTDQPQDRLGAYQLIYGYDKNGNITSILKSDTGQIERYAYDKLNRLISWYDPSRDTTTTYSYDEVGNLLEVKEGQTVVQSFTYDAASQITSQGFTYDANGNMTSDGTFKYTYNAEGWLAEVRRASDDSLVAQYSYYYNGLRKSKTVNGITTYFHYNSRGDLISETDASGNPTAYYTWDLENHPVSVTKGGQTYYFDLNAHGDVINLAGGSYSYDPWGKVLLEPSSGPGADNPIRYAGYYFDKETGLYYLKARYYSPEIKRFLTRDPVRGELKEPLSLNPYLYCKGDPVNRVDPTGLLSWRQAHMLLRLVWLIAWGYTGWFPFIAMGVFYAGL